jgi:hypothetical protein
MRTGLARSAIRIVHLAAIILSGLAAGARGEDQLTPVGMR